MRILALVAAIVLLLIFCSPLIMSAGKKFAAWARGVWREGESNIVKIVPKIEDEDKPK